MTEPDRRVATLAAVFVPERAAAILARLGTPSTQDASAHATALLAAPRRERLAALSAALAPDRAAARARAEAVATAERSRVGSIVRALAEGRIPAGASPVMLRLCRERIGR